MKGDGGGPRPPAAARRLLRALLPAAEREEIAETAAAFFRHLAATRGEGEARRWYWKEAWTAGPRLRFDLRREGTMGTGDAMGTIRTAFRSLLRSPGFVVATVATLGLGVGAATTAYSVVEGVLLEPLPWDEPDRLVSVMHTAPGIGMTLIPHAPGLHRVYGERARSFESMALYTRASATVLEGGRPERVPGALVTPSLFRVLRVEPALGRGFTEEEGRPGSPPRVVLSHAFWTERLGADPEVLGRSVRMDGESRTVVGVMPPGFAFPSEDARWWSPLVVDPTETRTFGGFNYPGIARLAEGATPASAARELEPLFGEGVERFGNLTPEFVEQGRIAPLVRPYMEVVVGDVRTPLWIVLATVGFVLLIACTNVANLTLVRAEARRRETAVRRALGAGRGHIAAGSLAESFLLAAAGTVLGLLLAAGGLHLVRTLGASYLPRMEGIGMDGSVLLVTLALTAGTTVVFGLLPLAGRRGGRVLGDERRGSTATRRSHRVRHALVAVQMAFAFVLLVGSGLMVRSFHALTRVDPGFRSEGVLTFRLALPETSYPGAAAPARFHRAFLERVRALPGVQAAGAVTRIPLTGLSDLGPWTARDRLMAPGGSTPQLQARAASPGYLEAMGIPLLQGRGSEVLDTEEAGSVVLVSRRAAEILLAHRDPLSGELAPGGIPSDGEATWARVAGVVGDAHYLSLTEEPTGVVYKTLAVPEHEAWQVRSMDYVVRASVPPTSLVPGLRDALRGLDPTLPLTGVRPLREVERAARAHTTFTMVMLVSAAAAGLLLGAVGLYGVLAWVTARRTREIGVRMALGAAAPAVRRMVLAQGLAVALAGMAAGAAGAGATGRFLADLLYGVSVGDPLTWGAVSAVLLLVSAVAVWLPARRASRVDVVEALRSE